jgi:RHS repeat-associated protein
MHNSPRFPYGYTPQRILVGDVDGDGLDDIIYVDHCKVQLWINQSGNGWSAPIEIDGTLPVTDMDAVRLVDLLGNGIAGVLWSADYNGARSTSHFLDFTGGVKPYLLSVMDNHLGAITRVEYTSSTRDYLADQVRPETRWQTTLPFPVQVVARVEVVDALSRGKLTTEYTYHHGYWDGAEREFRGFGRVEQRDTEVFADYNTPGLHGDSPFEAVAERHFSPPTLTKTWFHQGPIGPEHGDWHAADYHLEFWPGDPARLGEPPGLTAILQDIDMPRRAKRDALRTLRGSVLRTELYALDGTSRQERPYTVTESLYDVREIELPDDEPPERSRLPGEEPPERRRIFFPHRVAQRTTQWERGNDPMTQCSFTGDYDDYGQPRRQITLAVPRGRDYESDGPAGEPYLGTVSVTEYAQRDDDERYIVDRVARVTSHEIVNDGSQNLFDLRDAVLNDAAPLALMSQTMHFYDGAAFAGLPWGQLGDFGAVSRSESLVLTEDIVQAAYRNDADALEIPPFLGFTGPPAWTADYPQAFRVHLPALAGYLFHPGNDGLHARGYFVSTAQAYDFQLLAMDSARGLRLASRDALQHETRMTYDQFDLLPTQVTDPAGLSTQAEYDYRVMQPRLVTDPNGNQTEFTFTPLGLLNAIFVRGKAPTEGDTSRPSMRFAYDLLAFVASPPEQRRPISVQTIQHEHHDTETDVDVPERDVTIETVEYSDGFGRLLQTRTQAEDVFFGDVTFANHANLPLDQSEPGGPAVGQLTDANTPRVVVSGWQVYDNKGQVVEKYEPFFAAGWDYNPPHDDELGQSVTMFYDPRGQVIRTVNPDGSEQRVIYGIPSDLTNPATFDPTPWEAYTYDANDLAPLSEGPQPDGTIGSLAARAPASHHFTPSSIRIDALGRTVESIQRNRSEPENPGAPLPPIEEMRTTSTYDIRGNLLTVTDTLHRVAFRHAYDLANHPLRVLSIDAGLTRTVLDAAGSPVEQRDSKGALVLNAYDVLNRPIRLWARDDSEQHVTLRQVLIYGDSEDSGLDREEAALRNLLGQLLDHYDEAGRVQVAEYDFKGNLHAKTRRVIRDSEILSVFDGAALNNWQVSAYQVDWQPDGMSLAERATALLDPTLYTTTTAYDALNRVKQIIYPEDVEGQRRVLRPSYNRAGALERVALNGAPFVEHIAYNAKGQRTLIAYNNRVMTRYAYDERTFRLRRLRSERYTAPLNIEFVYHPAAPSQPLQDFAYEYDLVGNITAIHDRTPESGVPNTSLGIDALDRRFTYYAIYRLLSATGREHATPPPANPWDDFPKTQDVTLTRAYTERYRYDVMGNMEELRHIANGGSFTRDFTLITNGDPLPINNRLETVTIGQTVFDYTYDSSGNMTGETTSRHFEWNHSNQMKVFRTQIESAEPSIYAHYLYDAAGMRAKKLVRHQRGAFSTTVYVDGSFEHQIDGDIENNSLHVVDNQQRIALVRVGLPFPDDATPAIKFHLGDHLSSSNVVVDLNGTFINREEYTPYGETSFGSFVRKRYQFTGKERDEESGVSYHGKRYYLAWIVRWMSTDPVEMLDGINLYDYAKNNPLLLRDQSGLMAEPTANNVANGGTTGGTEEDEGTPEEASVESWEGSSNEEWADIYGEGIHETVLDTLALQMTGAVLAVAETLLSISSLGAIVVETENADPIGIQARQTAAYHILGFAGIFLGARGNRGSNPRAQTKSQTSISTAGEINNLNQSHPYNVNAPRPTEKVIVNLPEQGNPRILEPVGRPINPNETAQKYGNYMHDQGPLRKCMEQTYPNARYQVREGLHGPDVIPLEGLNFRFGELKFMFENPTRLKQQVNAWMSRHKWKYLEIEPGAGRYFFYDRNGRIYEGVMDVGKNWR